MANTIDYLMQDAESLLNAIDANRKAMMEKGFSDASYNAFKEVKEILVRREKEQARAVSNKIDKTRDQEIIMRKIADRITGVKSAAKSAFGRDQKTLKLFKIGDPIPNSVKKLRPLCEYLIGIVTEHHDSLIQNGLTEDDITGLNSSLGELVSIDTTQEMAKKQQVAATMDRDDAVEALKDKMFRIRNFAKVCFASYPDILVLFKPIPRGLGGRGKAVDASTVQPPQV